MARIAIDVALLPDPPMTETAIRRNKQLTATYPDKIALNQESCLPHISLCMGTVEQEDLSKIIGILRSISKAYRPLELTAKSITVINSVRDEQFSMFDIANTSDLQSLFESVMKQLRPFLSYNNVTASMFVRPTEIEDISLAWVEGYRKKHDNPESFNPHLSLGVGNAGTLDQPIPFTAPTLALCHLGNYCTCRKKLASFTLATS